MPRHAGASTHGEESQESQSRAEEGREKEEVKGVPTSTTLRRHRLESLGGALFADYSAATASGVASVVVRRGEGSHAFCLNVRLARVITSFFGAFSSAARSNFGLTSISASTTASLRTCSK